jgi:hypothetical protein
MATVESYCHRAALLSEGLIERIGDPGEVAREYLRINFEEGGDAKAKVTAPSDELRLLDIWLEDAGGERLSNVETGVEIRVRAQVEILRETPGVQMGFTLANEDGVGVFQFGAHTEEEDGPIGAGRRVTVDARLENLLTQGHYFVHFGIKRHPDPRATVLHIEKALDFLVFGTEPSGGIVSLPHTVETSVEDGA